MTRHDGRKNSEIREISFTKDAQIHPIASVLVNCGRTRVICSVSFENRVPGWMKAQNVPGGWVTAEYSMLPSATHTRNNREVKRGKESGRTMEIQRLIGRSLRAIIDLDKLGPITLNIDCDVLDADGGTRCASISGAAAALNLAVTKLMAEGVITENPIKEMLAAISVGVVDGEVMVDLCYEEDSKADVDMNIIMTESGRFVELQGTAEDEPFTTEQLIEMMNLAKPAIKSIIDQSKQV